jgi:hypothetical protein
MQVQAQSNKSFNQFATISADVADVTRESVTKTIDFFVNSLRETRKLQIFHSLIVSPVFEAFKGALRVLPLHSNIFVARGFGVGSYDSPLAPRSYSTLKPSRIHGYRFKKNGYNIDLY